MPLFSRLKNKGAQPASKDKTPNEYDTLAQAPRPRYVSNWNSKTIVPEEVQELIHACTIEMKSRAEALDSPFLLLPFRPRTDVTGARTFIANFFKSNHDGQSAYRGAGLAQELRLTEPIVLCSILKWCWSRMPGGVVSWQVYDGFQLGEKEANYGRNAFETFVPLLADSPARQSIIFDFYDLLAAVAAHGKLNGLGGRKLSRLAGWWAFEHSDDGKGFEGGYRSWTAAADASSHLFFAYLRTLSPEAHPSMSLIERIPRSLQALLASTEYPPETPTLMQKSTPRVVMIVDSVSPTPFALLRRAKHFEYRSSDRVLREYSEFDDPVEALTEECKRVLFAICNTSSSAAKSRHRTAVRGEEQWSAFQNSGFADWDEKALQNGNDGISGGNDGQSARAEARSRDMARPTTPSWADFMSAGFGEDELSKPATTLLLPPDKQLPPLSRATTPNYHDDADVAPGELAAIANVELDDAFWWVWMTSLAGEEPAERKAVFGRCAVIETSIMHGRWLIMEEQVKGASPEAEGAYIAKKKSIFSFTKRGRLSRKRSTNKVPPLVPEKDLPPVASPTPSRRSLAPDQQSKIKQAAAALKRQDSKDDEPSTRRGRRDDAESKKTNSVLTMGLQSEAGPAMKWTTAYDRSTIRAQYLGDPYAGRGISREDLRDMSTTFPTGGPGASPVSVQAATFSPTVPDVQTSDIGHELSTLPVEETTPTPNLSATDAETFSPEAPVPSTELETRDSDKEFVREVPAAPPAVVAEPVVPAPATAMDKEVSVEVAPISRRKPVPPPVGHPAYRQPSVEEARPASQSPTNPAALAAQLAAQRAMKPSTPETSYPTQSKITKKQSGATGGGGGLKKLFGRKKDHPNRQSMDGMPASSGLVPPADSSIGRRLSLMRKKHAPPESPTRSRMAMMHPNASELEAEPVMPDSFGAYHDSATNVSHTDSVQDANPEHEFARFDQSPADGAIGHQHDSVPEHVAAPQAQRNFNVPEHIADDDRINANNHLNNTSNKMTTAAPYTQHAQAIDDHDHDADHDDEDADDENHSQATMEDNPAHEPVAETKDRWAVIRENAARRAAQRASEEHSTQSRPSQSMRTDDDGETSGEETIESRVARIKARVAELTGGVERR